MFVPLAGKRTSALRQYKVCETALKDELGVQPSKRTLALYKQVQQDDLVGGTFESPLVTGVPSLPKALNQLNQLRSVLDNFHCACADFDEHAEVEIEGIRKFFGIYGRF